MNTLGVNRWFFAIFLALVLPAGISNIAVGQPECMAWGNLTGIRVEGQLMEFESSLCLIGSNLMQVSSTAKEQQQPRYQLQGNKQTITTDLDDISFTEVVESIGDGKALVHVEVTAREDTAISGAFFCLELPSKDFTDVNTDFIDSTASTIDPIPVFPGRRWRRFSRNTQVSAKGVRLISARRRIEVTITEPTEIIVQPGNPFFGNSNTRIYFAVLPGAAKKGQTAKKTFSITVSGDIDKTPILLHLDATKPGRAFDGIGGNFRLQNPTTDPQVIDYCLENLNVTWGRVELPWSNWHPVESVNPIEAARTGQIHPGVHEAMLMAQRLAKRKIPVILSAWRAPSWAVVGDLSFRQQGGLRGNPLNPAKMKRILKSIGSYILYLKEAYGVEAALFSFNESDLGINVRQTGEEHADLIKSLGAYMASLGLTTKMLLGDNSDANTYEFITPAIEDPETHQYIGALSFHSWRGCDDWTLSIWADAAKELHIPLLVGEGSTDAAAHRYPDIFLQPAFSLNEIDLYLRICKICQARSILQWQLTADYSVLTGDGIFNSKGNLRPTQRFWNLKQLGLTPTGSFNLPVTCDGPNVSCVAYGDIANGVYTVHIVNNGTTRQVTLESLPETIKALRIYITDHNRGMENPKRIQVTNGTARFTLDSMSFTSLIGVQ
jgi:hypothetical protein